MDGFCNSKTSNATSSPQRLPGYLCVVELERLTDDKFDLWEHELNCHSNRPKIILCANQKLRNILIEHLYIKSKLCALFRHAKYQCYHPLICSIETFIHHAHRAFNRSKQQKVLKNVIHKNEFQT